MAAAVPSDHDSLAVATWLPDPSHYPDQLTPLSATVWFAAVGEGLHAAMRQLQGPFGGFDARTHRGWAYEGELAPDWPIDEEVLDQASRDLQLRWDTELRPQVESITSTLHSLRPERYAPDAALDALRRMHALVREQWTIHFLAVVPAQVAVERFEAAYRDKHDDDDPFRVYALLDAVDNETNRADEQLRRLADRAVQLDVADVLTDFPPSPALDRLALTMSGRRFLRDLDRYLLAYGGRSRWHELSIPREVEHPTMAIESIRLFLQSGTRPSLVTERRQPLLADPDLEELLRNAQSGYSIKEGHVHFIDYPGLLATREVLRGFGRRLYAQGILNDVEDVWMLQLTELEGLLAGDDIDVEELVTIRRAEMVEGREEGPRPYLGDPPSDRDRHVVLEKFYGSPVDNASGSVLIGTAASPGSAEGRARIVRSTEDFSKVDPGDVLVAATTTPAWTPLFPSVAAIVTETGGVLCHGAIVAREYGKPAVVGTTDAMTRIPDGAVVRVHGDTGKVEIV